MLRQLLCGIAALAAAGAPLAPAAAGSFSIDPIKVEIREDRKIGSVRVTNEGSEPVTIRGHALSWAQVDGEDVQQPVTNVIVSPPIATIAPGATQLVRVGLRANTDKQEAYRLIIEEVPQASQSGAVQVAIRLNLPLYVNLEQGEPEDLVFSAAKAADGKWALEASNRGRGYVRINPDAAAAATGIDAERLALIGTVLPGSSRRIILEEAPADAARFQSIVRASDAKTSLATHR